MTKEIFVEFVNACKECGIDDYVVRCEGGNRLLYNTATSIIFIKDEYIECLEHSRNHEVVKGAFDIIRVPYDNIDTVKTVSAQFTKTLELMKKLGYYDEDPRVKEFLQNSTVRRDIVPGTANLGPIKDSEDKTVLPERSVGYVVK